MRRIKVKPPKPAWRAHVRDPRLPAKQRFTITVSAGLRDALASKAHSEGCSSRSLADMLINRALDEAGEP